MTLEITEVAIYEYELSYVHGEYVMSGNRVIEKLTSLITRVVTAEGIVGYGEVCPLGPAYLPAHSGGASAALAELAPAIIGLDSLNFSAVHAALDRALMGHGYAKSAIDMACWDIFARYANVPVCDGLGGRLQSSFPLYFAVPHGPATDMARYVADRRNEGVHRFQLKLGADPHEDALRVKQVLADAQADDLFIADANGGWRLRDAMVAARELDALPRLYLEQPCPTLEECLAVRSRTTLPMVLDESITDLQSLLRAHTNNGMEAFNLKISKVGGLSRAKLMRDLAQELGLSVTIEDTWGGDIVTAAVSHLAASTRPENLLTVSFMNDWTNEHVAAHQPQSSSGFGAAPSGPGLGINVDVEALGTPWLVVRSKGRNRGT